MQVLDYVRVDLLLPLNDARKLVGLPMRVGKLNGIVESFDPSVSTTGEVRVHCKVANPNHTLIPGQSVKVDIERVQGTETTTQEVASQLSSR